MAVPSGGNYRLVNPDLYGMMIHLRRGRRFGWAGDGRLRQQVWQRITLPPHLVVMSTCISESWRVQGSHTRLQYERNPHKPTAGHFVETYNSGLSSDNDTSVLDWIVKLSVRVWCGTNLLTSEYDIYYHMTLILIDDRIRRTYLPRDSDMDRNAEGFTNA